MFLIFEFAKATEVTDWAFKLNKEYQSSGYTRVFITPDVNDYHLLRVLPGFNEKYEKDDSSILLEYEKISKPRSVRGHTQKVKEILIQDSFENWDCKAFSSMGDVLEHIDGGFGINNQKENDILL